MGKPEAEWAGANEVKARPLIHPRYGSDWVGGRSTANELLGANVVGRVSWRGAVRLSHQEQEHEQDKECDGKLTSPTGRRLHNVAAGIDDPGRLRRGSASLAGITDSSHNGKQCCVHEMSTMPKSNLPPFGEAPNGARGARALPRLIASPRAFLRSRFAFAHFRCGRKVVSARRRNRRDARPTR